MWVLGPWPGIKSGLPRAFGAHIVFTTGPPEKSLVEAILFVSTPFSTQSTYGSDGHTHRVYHNIQFSSVAQLCPTLCDLMNCSTPGLPVHHQLPEFTQTHVGDAIQPSPPLSSPSSPAPNPSQHQGLFKWVNSAWGGQSIGVSASVFPKNTQDWSPLGWTGCISLQSKGLSRVFSNTTVQKHQFLGTQLSL